MTEISDLERAVLDDPVVMAAVTEARAGDRSQLRYRELPSDDDRDPAA